MRCFAGIAVLAGLVAPASAEAIRPRTARVQVELDRGHVGQVVNSKTIFLNRCAGGCQIKTGYTDSRTNTSGIGQGTLTAFNQGNASWTSVMNCMKGMFSRFNVTVTDVDPGPMVDHFEVM